MSAPATCGQPRVASSARARGLLRSRLALHVHWVLLGLVVALALFLRLYRLVPLDTGLLYAQDADEGVYATTAQLWLQGYLPYRDFFTPMPPAAIYLFAAVLRLVYHPWGNAAGLMALRYASVAYGMATVLLTYRVGRMLGGRWSGLLAAALVGIDGIVVAQDRRAMLEAPTNLFSLAAILCYLSTLLQSNAAPSRVRRPVWLVVSGFFATFALLLKGTAIVPLAVIGLAVLIQRRWRDALWFGGSVLASYVLLAALFIILCPQEYVKQTYFFHMLRPWDGTWQPLGRVLEIWRYTWSWTTTRTALLGGGLTLLVGRRLRRFDGVLVVGAWAGMLSLLLLSSRTYWATYFSQLAVPFAILGGLVLADDLAERPLPFVPANIPPSRTGRFVQVALLALLIATGYSALPRQWTTTRAALEQVKPSYVAIATAIDQSLPSDARILVFETNYTFLSSRVPAGSRDGSFFVDSYGEMLYRNLDIPGRSLSQLLAAWRREKPGETYPVFHRQPAQDDVLASFARAGYAVVDFRALKQLTPETASFLQSHSRVLSVAYNTELRERVQD